MFLRIAGKTPSLFRLATHLNPLPRYSIRGGERRQMPKLFFPRSEGEHVPDGLRTERVSQNRKKRIGSDVIGNYLEPAVV
jgi:hypothetical protein